MKLQKIYTNHKKLIFIALMVSLVLSFIPRTADFAISSWQTGKVLAYEATVPPPGPNYIGPQFDIFSRDGEYGRVIGPMCDYPSVPLPAAHNGWPFAVFEVDERGTGCSVHVLFAPVGFALNYLVALTLVGSSMYIIRRSASDKS